MPAVTGYLLEQNSTDARAVEEAYCKEADARRAAFALRWQYYDGEMRKPLKLQADGVDDNVLLPKVGEVIDKLVSFLLGDGIEFDASGDQDTESPIDKRLAEIWQASRGSYTQRRLAMFGAICGHPVARVEPGESLPRITALNPEQVSVFWDAFDQSRVLWYRLQHRLGRDGQGKRIDYVRGAPNGATWNHDVDGWTERVFTIAAMAPEWKLQSEQWLDYCPIIDWQNLSCVNDYYGQDEVANVLALNDALNFACSNYSRIIKHYATPKTVGLGFTVEEDVKQGAGDLLTITKPPSEADVRYLEMTSDLASVRDWIGMLAGEIWAAARMPDPQNLKDKVGALTNFGLRLLYNDALNKMNDKRALYQEGFERINKLALQLAGAKVPESIAVLWPDPLPKNTTEEVQAEQIEVTLGTVSKQTAAEERGRDWEREQQRMKKEQAAAQAQLGTSLMNAMRNFDRGNAPDEPAEDEGNA